VDEEESLFDDLGESDITGGLLFGKPGSGEELLAPDDSTTAAAAALDGSAEAGLGSTTATKLQGLYKWAPKLPFGPKGENPEASGSGVAAVDSSAGGGAENGADGTAAAAAGGLLGGVTAAVSGAGGGLKGLLDLPAEVAGNVGGALDDLR
jgi:hypothetical protein